MCEKGTSVKGSVMTVNENDKRGDERKKLTDGKI